MTATTNQPAPRPATEAPPLVQLENVGKHYGHITAIQGINLQVGPGEVTCVLGDNGAGKSTLIKIISGRHPHDEGTVRVDGEEVKFGSPRDALDKGIATVYQDLAVVPLMPVWRNFFLGSEETNGFWPIRRLKVDQMRETAKEELHKMGIDLPDIDAPIGSLSGGQRQCVAIARAVFFGARVLILDEPTAALGVKQSGVVLKYIAAAAQQGLGVIFITHNPHHAYMVGDHMVMLNRGRMALDCKRNDITLDELTQQMAGGDELDALSHELQRSGAVPEAVLQQIEAREAGEKNG
ncbi:MAG TPA: ATP-binding cassette domain-containing protein [Nocardioidaceae bacterium]|nr:ATP-binding cassette domain-containing protein [Nocardioidaceae bacterium]